MKWKDIKTQSICFDKDNWDKIIKELGTLEDKYGLEISISDMIDALTRFSVDNMKPGDYLSYFSP